MSTTTKEQREELRRLHALATPGPWRADVAWSDQTDAWRVFFEGHPNPRTNTRDCYLPERDARLIAAARNALTFLLDEADARDAEIAELRACLSHARGWLPSEPIGYAPADAWRARIDLALDPELAAGMRDSLSEESIAQLERDLAVLEANDPKVAAAAQALRDVTAKIVDADDLVARLGASLVGRLVNTPPMGDWTGGACTVIEIRPDPNAPDIAFNVRRESDGEEIGVFDYEIVELLPEVREGDRG